MSNGRGGGGGGGGDNRPRDNCPLDCKVYVGELGSNGSRTELEQAFGYYGPLKNVWVARNPPGFAFVMFENARDARDACRALNGRSICGRKVRVELSSGKTRREMGDGDRDRYSPPPRQGGDRGGYSPRRSPPRGRSPPPRERYARSPSPRGRYTSDYPPARGSFDGRPAKRLPPRRSRSPRTRSPSPLPRGIVRGGHKSRTPISHSRSQSMSKSPEPQRYR